MKNFNRLFVGLILSFGFMMVGSLSHATVGVRAPKKAFVTPFSLNGSTVTPVVSTNAVANAAFESGAVYQVILTTGGSGQYIVMFDSGNCTGLTTASTITLTVPLFYGSTSANTVTTFDPPLEFFNGLCVYDSSNTGHASITYELGRGLSGQ